MSAKVGQAKLWHRAEKRLPHIVVISVGGVRRQRHFPTKKAATAYQGRVNTARDAGELFDPETGEPVSWADDKGTPGTVAEMAVQVYADRHADLRAKSRSSLSENLGWAVALSCPSLDRASVYAVTVKALTGKELDRAEAETWKRIRQVSQKLGTIGPDTVTEWAGQIATNLDGSSAKASTVARRRGGIRQALEAGGVAVEWPKQRRGTKRAKSNAVSPRRIGTPEQVAEVVAEVTIDGYSTLYRIMFLAGLRPGEAVALQWEYIDLAAALMTVAENSPDADPSVTDSGERYDIQPPKWRTDGSARPVPMVPALVELLEALPSRDGLVCVGAKGQRLTVTGIDNTWAAARKKVGAGWPSTRLATPYDLRHSHASIGLSAGIPVKELADRLGHSPGQLLETYAHTVEADAPRWTSVLGDALG